MQAKYVSQAMHGGRQSQGMDQMVDNDVNLALGTHISTSQIENKNEYFHRRLSNVNFDFHLNRQLSISEKHNIVRICLTGGPCAGKTTAIASIK